MNCPTCPSDQTQPLSVIFEAGTSIVESKVSGGGVAFTGDGLAPVLGTGSSKGVQQTALAAKASPPARQPVGQFVLFALFGSPVLAVVLCLGSIVILALLDLPSSGIAGSIPEIVAVGSWLVLTVIGISNAVLGYRYNRNEWPILYETWQGQWLCHRCGSEFSADDMRAAA